MRHFSYSRRATTVAALLALVAMIFTVVILGSPGTSATAKTSAAKSKTAAKKKKKKKKAKKKLPAIGIGDNNAPMFEDANYRKLGFKIARRIVPWDFHKDPVQEQTLTEWLANARKLKIQPLISFERSYTDTKKLPSVKQYGQSLRYLRKKWPWVKTISPWNEANHQLQPTAKNPKRAAQYYNYTLRNCKGCTIVAADLLDQRSLIPWTKKFLRYANKKKKKIWGLHNYGDSNYNKKWSKTLTRKFLKTFKGDVWFTETGGLVTFGGNFHYDLKRSARSVKKTLDLSLKDKRIKRVYLYCWYGVQGSDPKEPPYIWDSGFVNPNSTLRPSYKTLDSWLKKYKFKRVKHPAPTAG